MDSPKYQLFFSENAKQIWIILFFSISMTGAMIGSMFLFGDSLSENEMLGLIMAEVIAIMALMFYLGKTMLSVPVEITLSEEHVIVEFLKTSPIYRLSKNPFSFADIKKFTISSYKGKDFVSMQIMNQGGVTFGSDSTPESKVQLKAFSEAFQQKIDSFNQSSIGKTHQKPIAEYDMYQTAFMKVLTALVILMAVGYTIGMLNSGRPISTFEGWLVLYGSAIFLGYRVFLFKKKAGTQ